MIAVQHQAEDGRALTHIRAPCKADSSQLADVQEISVGAVNAGIGKC